MSRDKDQQPDGADPRQKAEARMAQNGDQRGASPDEHDARRLLHQLQVRQIELELQNEELLQARQQLATNLERYADLFDSAPIGFFTLDAQGVIREVNLAGAALLGAARSQVLGRDLDGFLAPDSLAAFGELLERVRAGQAGQSCRVKLAAPIKTPRHLRIEGSPVKTPEAGAAPAGQGHIRLAALDISERHQAELSSRTKTATLTAIFDSAPYVMLLVNRDSRVVDINHAGVSLAAREKPALLGLLGGEIFRCLNSFDAQRCGRGPHCPDCPIRTRVERTFATGEAIYNAEGGLDVLRDGRTEHLDMLISTSLLNTDDGDLVMISIVDISKGKRAENRLRENQAFTKGIIESSADCIKVLDMEGRLAYMSPGGLRLLGIDDIGPYLNQRYETFWRQSDLEAVRAALARGQAGQRGGFQGFCPTVAGEPKWWDVMVNPIFAADGAVEKLLVVSRDITERKLAAEEHAKMEAQLHQAQKMEAIGTLAGGIAHDFNNILAVIMGFAEMARDDAKTGQAKPADMEEIIKAAGRARDLVRHILAFSRKSLGSLSPLNLNRTVEGVVQMLARMMPKEINIELDLSPALADIQADASQLDQVLMNLATNARDAMPDGGDLIIRTRNEILDEAFCRQYLEVLPGSYVLLKVADTGHGMDQRTLRHMYDPFFTTKGVGKGTGLGLSSIHGMVKSHGGYIFCQSSPDQGTTFDIYLPALKKGGAQIRPEGEPLTEAPGGDRAILLVDDEPALRDMGARVLRSAGYRVVAAISGEEALDIYRTGGQRPDLIILDLGMPGMGGIKFLDAVLKINPQVKVIIASGYDAQAQVKDALAAGAAGFVAKPFRKAELLGKIREVLNQAAT
jgi:PAS domain S-box-containing protein